MKDIYFISSNIKQGSTILRGFQIMEELKNNISNNIHVIEKKNIETLYDKENCIFIWIGPQLHNYYFKLKKNNIHILDIVDKFISNPHGIIDNLKLYNGIIVNSKFMRDYFLINLNYKGNIFIIFSHWDHRIRNTITSVNELIFGYMGSIVSLQKSTNFLHYNKLVNEYNIIFYDTEIGEDVTNFVKQNKINFPVKFVKNNMPTNVNFNCDISIRPNNSNESYFKTSAKLTTAAALNHNIITTYEKAVMDLLPDTYPFILKETDIESVRKMFNLVIQDYNSDKKLWNYGLELMKPIKDKLDLKNIIKDYVLLINFYS